MNRPLSQPPSMLPTLGCAAVFIMMTVLCLLPFMVVELMDQALSRLHLPPWVAGAALVGIVIGGLFNIPLYRISRDEEFWIDPLAVYGIGGLVPRFRRARNETVIAVNVGGCIIPLLLVVLQLIYLANSQSTVMVATGIATMANILICNLVARPVHQVGIMMPAFTSPLVAVGMSWLLLANDQFDPDRPAVAFVAGVLGPLIGADLLNLRQVTKMSTGLLSIGGAGTFDGIVLSGILAALTA